jgi:hypothetical protein
LYDPKSSETVKYVRESHKIQNQERLLVRGSRNLPEQLTTKGTCDNEATRNKIHESRAHSNQARGAKQLNATILHACKQLYP